MVSLTIDGRKVEVEEGTTVLQAAEKLGIKIPTLCYHKALEPQGACRLCVVEITGGGRPGLAASCAYVATDGLEVQTRSERVIKARKLVIELLLLRCPDVPRIKELAEEIGIDRARYERFQPEKEECILCGLCVRVCQERMGVGAINFINRGAKRRVAPPFDRYSEICVTCGACEVVCPTGAINLDQITENKPRPILSEFNVGLNSRPSIYSPFAQSVPRIPVIDRSTCMHFLRDACKSCENFCAADAINYDQEDEILNVDVGAVILAPGFDEFDPTGLSNYGYQQYPNVVTSIEFERILSATGPYQGNLLRPSDKNIPRKIAFIQCVGSRDSTNPYCSSVCCTYAVKEAIVAKEHAPVEIEETIFYMDMRTYGKDFDKYQNRAEEEYGVRFVRARVASVEGVAGSDDLRLTYETEDGKIEKELFNLVVLSVGFNPPESAKALAEKLGIKLNKYNFAQTNGLSPLATSREGIYVCGAFSGPKDIPETVMQASGAVGTVGAILSEARGTLVKAKEYPPEKDVAGKEPRIGVFVCHCGINIGGVVDVPAVTEYAKTLPFVVYAENNLFTCSDDTQKKIRETIAEHDLNRVIVASCSPRTHEPLFQETLKEAGLNKYLFEMANIRDQCSWIHMHEHEKATEKAKDLVRMAAAKAALLEPLATSSLDINSSGLVIGGGIAGMTSALNLAEQGFKVFLIERESELGGNLRRIYYTVEGEDTQEYLKKTISEIEANRNIEVFLDAEIEEIAGYVGNFKTSFKSAGKSREIEHGIVIVATGAKEYRPDEYLYGEHENVLTQLELEERLAQKTLEPKSLGTVVMIQCVGSRDNERPYCSRVCCTEAVKNALKIKEVNPEANIFILYRDMRTYGFKEVYYEKAREAGVMFIRYDEFDKPELIVQDGELKVSLRDPVLRDQLIIDTDLLILSVATVPEPNNENIAQMLKIPLNDDKFFLEAHMKLRPVDFATEGVFVAGLAHSPKFIDEAIAQAKAAAGRASTIISKKSIEAEGIIAAVNEDICDGCGICQPICEYKAIDIVATDGDKKKAVVNEALCKGCGACVGACPSGAMEQKGFKDNQLMALIDAALEETAPLSI
jgi:heterodisulfide reductase subunit A